MGTIGVVVRIPIQGRWAWEGLQRSSWPTGRSSTEAPKLPISLLFSRCISPFEWTCNVKISSLGVISSENSNSVTISKNGTKMRLLSPIDDFLSNTLSALGSLLDRLEYVAGLKTDGKYRHWGLAKT